MARLKVAFNDALSEISQLFTVFSVCELQTFHAHVLGMDLSTNMINFALQAYERSKSSLVCMISINKKMGIN